MKNWHNIIQRLVKNCIEFFYFKQSLKLIFLYLFLALVGLAFVLGVGVFFLVQDLPSLMQLKHYHPPLLSIVLDRNGDKVGEFFRERRVLTPYEDFPDPLVKAFVSAEDGDFFKHKGLHYQAIFRAFLTNLKKGRKVQGGSTITQQVARSVLLSSEKTYRRKLKEAILALRLEKTLNKEEILYLYLNQIYLGHGVYGVGMAAKVYFRKEVKDLSLAECALLAGLPKAPSRFSPIQNPSRARSRQLYVLNRMVEESYISQAEAEKASAENIKVYFREETQKLAPYYLETLRQILNKKVGEESLLTGGLRIHSSMDYPLQALAQKHLKSGLKSLDKRQGFRGPINHLTDATEIEEFFKTEENKLKKQNKKFLLIGAKSLENTTESSEDNHAFSIGDETRGIVRLVSDKDNQVLVEIPFHQFGIIPLENMKWARKPNPKISPKYASLLKPSLALKEGDLIQVKIKELKYPSSHLKLPDEITTLEKTLLELSLDQEPLVEGAVLVMDQKSEDIVALVGGYNFNRSQFNRVYQATRQTGSVFKPIVYLAALDKGFTPADLITDAPVVYAKEEAEENKTLQEKNFEEEEKEEEAKKWKPFNYSRRFSGDILFRNALIRSMNVPTVKVIEKVGIDWVKNYARRLGLFHPLNPDYTLALGSSSITLYEMTKAFSTIGRLGKKVRPRLLKSVDLDNQHLLESISLDVRFTEELQAIEQELEEKRVASLKIEEEKSKAPRLPFFFEDPDQIISPKTAFIMTTLLNAAIKEPGGTGYRARTLKQSAAGKTGTTNGYYDAWFIGYTPDFIVGVWVGFDNEKSLGIGETGSKAALPIWLEFMKEAYTMRQTKSEEKLPIADFTVPDGIVFANIDNETGALVTSKSKKVISQAFMEGTEPKPLDQKTDTQEDQNFFREDLSEY